MVLVLIANNLGLVLVSGLGHDLVLVNVDKILIRTFLMLFSFSSSYRRGVDCLTPFTDKTFLQDWVV